MAFFQQSWTGWRSLGSFSLGGKGMGFLRVGALRLFGGRCCGCSEAWVREFWSSKRSYEFGVLGLRVD